MFRNWKEFAQCRKPEHAGLDWAPKDPKKAEPLRVICAACPVRIECLIDGAEDRHTVRAGLMPIERGLDPRCGTSAGPGAHRRRKEPLCAACRTYAVDSSVASRRRRKERENA